MAFVPTDLDWQAVTSSNVAAVAYQADFRRLWVRFKSDEVYSYEDVPRGIYDGFLAAPSKGRYVHSVLRNGGRDNVYAYRGPH